jgi:Flp pilus assembly protein TadD
VALDLAEALMATGDKEVGSQLIEFVARNNHEDESLLKRAKDIFEQAEMGEAGIEVLESSRHLATEAMDKGVRLSSQGKLEEGIAVMREACALMPNNARVLLNHAYLLISFIDKHGWQEALWNEAHRCIDTARKHSTDDKRCGQLQAKLETIKPS